MDGNPAVGPLEPDRGMDVIMAVQDQLDAVLFQQRQQSCGIGQPFGTRVRMQGVMDQQDAKRLLGGE